MTTTLLQDIGMTWSEFVRVVLDVDANVTAHTFAMQLERRVFGRARGVMELGPKADYATFVAHPFVVKQYPVWLLIVFDREDLWRNDVEEASMVLEGEHLLEFPWHAYAGHTLHGRNMVLRTTSQDEDRCLVYNLSTDVLCCESFDTGLPLMLEFLWGSPRTSTRGTICARLPNICLQNSRVWHGRCYVCVCVCCTPKRSSTSTCCMHRRPVRNRR